MPNSTKPVPDTDLTDLKLKPFYIITKATVDNLPTRYLTRADAKAAIALANSEGNLETMYVGKVITRTRVVQPAVNPVDEDI